MGNIHLTLPEVKEARRRAWLGDQVKDIAADMGHSYAVIWTAVRGKTWSTVHNPPAVPSDYAPIVFRVCVNEHCGDLYQDHPMGGLCQACYSYKWRNDGRMRVPDEIPLGRKPMDIGDLDALYRRYLQGESTDAIAEDLACSPQTLRRRFRLDPRYEMRENTAHNRVLSEAEVAQARTMYYDDDMPINEIADYLGHNYLTVFDAVKWKTWRTAGGPMPEDAAPEDGGLHPCERCGVQTAHRLCRYCREEMRERA